LHSWLAKNGDGDDIDEEALFLFRVSAPADDGRYQTRAAAWRWHCISGGYATATHTKLLLL
jgi:hypothetical protein